MNLKLKSILLILLVTLTACEEDQEPPVPDPIHSYFNLYNFFTESYGLSWEIDGLLVESEHSYGISLLQSTIMEEEAQEVAITVKQSGTERILGSEVVEAKQNQFHSAFLLGNEQDPRMLLVPMELEKPSLGRIKWRFLHASLDLGSVDIYIGGHTAEYKAVSGVPFAQLTEYMESTQEELWESIIITPFETTPEDSILLSYQANNAFLPDHIYLGVIGHANNSQTSSLHLILYDQPVY